MQTILFNGQSINLSFAFKQDGKYVSMEDVDFTVFLFVHRAVAIAFKKSEVTTKNNIIWTASLTPFQTNRLGQGAGSIAYEIVNPDGSVYKTEENNCFIIKRHISNEL